MRLLGTDHERFKRHRDNWAEKKGPEGLVDCRGEKKAASIDALPFLTRPGLAQPEVAL
jgi:hypothetical protein